MSTSDSTRRCKLVGESAVGDRMGRRCSGGITRVRMSPIRCGNETMRLVSISDDVSM